MTTTTKKRKKTNHKKTPLGKALIEALTEAVAFRNGAKTGATVHTVTVRRAKADPAPEIGSRQILQLRKRLKMSQPLFAEVLNVSPAAVKAWERGANVPGGAALRLLQIAESHPEIILERVGAR